VGIQHVLKLKKWGIIPPFFIYWRRKLRLTKITTKNGDYGKTTLGNGGSVSKTDIRIHVLGSIDELNSFIGVFLYFLKPEYPGYSMCKKIQHKLFDIGGEVSIPNYRIIDDTDILELENEIENINTQLLPLENFIIPGGSQLVSNIHVSRAICRRVERNFCSLPDYNEKTLIYLNRLSDYFFVLARFFGVDMLWSPKEKR
jgi:cob(I)alamin adenosyltransferase